jgi:hypothetical protein
LAASNRPADHLHSIARGGRREPPKRVDKMKTPEAQATYKLRKPVAEFPNLWLKEKLGLRRLCVRGLDKVTCESLRACLTYNLQQWWRARWKPQRQLAVAA